MENRYCKGNYSRCFTCNMFKVSIQNKKCNYIVFYDNNSILLFKCIISNYSASELLRSQNEEIDKLKEHIQIQALKISELEHPIPTNIRGN